MRDTSGAQVAPRPPGAAMPALWQQIVEASSEVDRAVAGVPSGAPLGAERTAKLHQAVRDALDALRAQLVAVLDERTTYETLFPLVLQFDERVTGRLDERDAAAWPLLQRELYNVETGGDLFYDLAEQRLAEPGRAPLTLAMLLYCLRNGFVGKAADDPTDATELATRLAQAIALPVLPPAAGPPVAQRASPPRSATIYYVLTALIVGGVALYLVLRS
jgi:type VI secretion system protein ImpK